MARTRPVGLMRRGGRTGGASRLWSPLSDPDTVVWFDSFTGLESSDGVMTQWTDRASGIVMSPHGTPDVESRQVTGAPCVHLNNLFAQDEWLTAPIGSVIGGTNKATIFFVGCHPNGISGLPFEYGGDSTAAFGTFSLFTELWAGAGGFSYYASVNLSTTSAVTESLDLPRVFTLQHDFSLASNEQVLFRSDGVNYPLTHSTNYDTATNHLNGTLYIGKRHSSNDYFWSGRVMGLVIVKRALTTPEIAQFETYLRHRYTMPLSIAGRRTPRIIHLGQSNGQGSQYSLVAEPIQQYAGPWNGYIRAYRTSNITGALVTENWRWAAGRQYGVVSPFGYCSFDYVAMGRLLTDYGYAPEIIEHTHGGTMLATDWAAGGGTYNAFLTTYDNAIATHPASPSSPEPIIFWTQGESDATIDIYADAYGDNLADLFSRMGVDRPALANVKSVIPLLNPNITWGTPASRAAIRAGQQAYADANPSRVRVVETSDLATADGVHYTAASHYTLSERVAAAAAELLG